LVTQEKSDICVIFEKIMSGHETGGGGWSKTGGLYTPGLGLKPPLLQIDVRCVKAHAKDKNKISCCSRTINLVATAILFQQIVG